LAPYKEDKNQKNRLHITKTSMLVVRIIIFMLGLNCPCSAIPGFVQNSVHLPLFGSRGSTTKPNLVSISAMVPSLHTIADPSISAVTYNALSHCLTGGIAASASHGLTVPLDVIKTRLQTDESLKNAGVLSTALKVT
jgi:hypothetical protein